MRQIFTKYIFLLLISLFGFGYILGFLFGNVSSIGINKTVGWAYSISNEALNALVFSLSQCLFIVGYFIVFLLKRKTNYYLSLAHFELIILILILMSLENFAVALMGSIASLLLFFINIVKSHKD